MISSVLWRDAWGAIAESKLSLALLAVGVVVICCALFAPRPLKAVLLPYVLLP